MQKTTEILKTLNPRVLVLGGSGRVGGLLRAVWRRPDAASGIRPIWQARRHGAGAQVVFDPLAEPQALASAVAACDVVLNLAGPTRGMPEELAANRVLAETVVQAAGGAVPILAASSAAVYGAQAAAGGALSEDGPTTPDSAYGREKIEMEAALHAVPNAVVIRIGNIAGADALLGRAAPEGGRVLHVTPDGRALERSYIGPQALAQALERLVRLAAAGLDLPKCLNLALPGVVGMDALLAAAGERWTSAPAPAGTIPRVELDVSRALRLGLVPDTPVRAEAVVADLQGCKGMRP